MTAINYVAPRRARGRFALSLGGLFAAYADWRRTRAAEAELKNMPDHVLDDLGITRGDIALAVRNGRR